MKQKSFFDEENRLERLSLLGDQLETLSKAVDFEIFRPKLLEIWPLNERPKGGRPSWDVVLMFKTLYLKKKNNVGDDKLEFLINDRISWQRFLKLGLQDKVPDAKSIWLYGENLTKSGRMEDMFEYLDKVIEDHGIDSGDGVIVDATFHVRPQQKYNFEKKKYDKDQAKNPEDQAGVPPPDLSNPHKTRQIDKDADYGVKRNKPYFGYKNHVKVSAKTKLIKKATVTVASEADNTTTAGLVSKGDKNLWGDSAYRGEKTEEAIRKITEDININIVEGATKGHPLTAEQKVQNKEKSKIRCRVEHVFGHMAISMGGKFLRCVGIKRSTCQIQQKNLFYNLDRLSTLHMQGKIPRIVT